MDFDSAVDILLSDKVEGEYTNNRTDPGGETMWGVTRRTAMKNGYTGDMHFLPKETAKAIYKKEYWDPIKVDSFPDAFRYALFDACVNSGPGHAISWLQEAIGLQSSGVVTDMEIGTAANLANPYPAAAHMIGIRLDFLTSLPTWGMFGRGWSRRIAVVLSVLAGEEVA